MKAAALVLVALLVVGCVVFEPPTSTVGPPTPTPASSPKPTATPTASAMPSPSPAPTATPTSTPAPTPSPPPPTPTATPPIISTAGACGDAAYTLNGNRWDGPYEWRFSIGTVPDYLDPDDVLDVLKAAIAGITEARNDCGLPDQVDATARYAGTTDEIPCDLSNTHNVVGFGRIPRRLGSDTIAYTCSFPDPEGNVFAADVMFSTSEIWALDPDECQGRQEPLEATMTHEAGHVFGLSHVSERRHGELTMSTRISGCDDGSATLGLGDILGLEELY